MACRRILKLGLVLLVCVAPVFSFAYDNETTHRAITQEALKLFNHYYPAYQLAVDEMQKVEDGSSDEDNGGRFLWHFYDPIHNIGFADQFETSKLWAQDTDWQRRQIRKINPLASYFGSDSDYSWDRAIFDYVHGDKERGLEALGHVVHLVEDKAVPDHTRDDNHALGSPYEIFAQKYTVDSLLLAKELIGNNQKPIVYNDLDIYFDNLAKYSNNNFFSVDTLLNSGYRSPSLSGKVLKVGDEKFVLDSSGNYKVALVIERFNDKTGIKEKNYFLDDGKYLVFSDYWNLLSKQAVLNSAGVIKLFFDEVVEEERTNALAEKNKSLALKTYEKIAASVDSALASVNLFAGKEIESPTVAASSTPLVATDEPPKIEAPILPDNNQQKIILLKQAISLLQDYQIKLLAVKDNTAAVGQLVVAQANLSGSLSGLRNHSELETVADEIDQLTPTTTEIIIFPPTITVPADLAQTFSVSELTFSGTASLGQIIFTDFSNATTSADSTGLWSLMISDLADGTNTLNFFAKDLDGNISDPLPVSVFVELPKVLSLTGEITECQNSFIEETCVIPFASQLNFSWSLTGGEATRYQVASEYIYDDELQRDILISTTETSAEVTIPRWFEKIVILALDQDDQVIASTSVPVVFRDQPIVISEIAPLGTTSSRTDEWVELYNPMPYSYDLSNVILRSRDSQSQVELNGTLNSKDYYLIEKDDDESVSDISADLTTDFGADEGADIFPIENIRWELVKKIGDQEVVLDQTLDNLSYCSSAPCDDLFDASSTPEIYSLERSMPDDAKHLNQYWRANNPDKTRNGQDRASGLINGTPKKYNSASIPDQY